MVLFNRVSFTPENVTHLIKNVILKPSEAVFTTEKEFLLFEKRDTRGHYIKETKVAPVCYYGQIYCTT